ncbi:MAG: hypothetical protein HYZ74_03175 [Elusimicrobia bacterium]|nr:hypothetical protein [Elusimicrobiota bacterium]
MNCQTARRLLSEALDGQRLDSDFSSHVAGCAACARAAAGYRALGAAFAALPERRPSASFNAAVLRNLKRRPAAPSASMMMSLIASSTLLALGATRLTIAPAGVGALAAKACATLEAAVRLASLLPAPRLGAEFAAAGLLAAALFLTISLPRNAVQTSIGAKQ